MKMKDINKYVKENFAEHLKNGCRSCARKTEKRLIRKETGQEFPFCQRCIDLGFYNKEVFEVKEASLEVKYTGGFEYLEHNHLVIGQKYIVEGNKVYSHSRNSMITVTAEQMIKYFELVK